jgi:glycosyltransferase involved in cell wall biosynthesis
MVAVSICLPVYNGETYLDSAIDSVLAQTFADFELIIVDDCSTDESFAIAQKYAASDARVRVFRNGKNLGLFQNYNRCLNEAKGTFIKTFAQDDVLEPTMLETVVAAFKAHPNVGLISTGKRWVSASGETLQTFKQFPENTVLPGREVIRYNLIQLTNWVGEPSTVTFRSNLRDTGFDTELFHYGDIDYWFRIVEKCDYLYISEPLCAFRRHAKSATCKNLNGMYFALDILRMGRKYQSYLNEIGETPEHFAKRAVETIALNLDHLVRNEDLDLEKCLAARPAQMPIDEAQAFKQLSYDACRYVTELLEKISDLEHKMVDQRKTFEAQIQNMQESTSWKITAPLRGMAKTRGGA